MYPKVTRATNHVWLLALSAVLSCAVVPVVSAGDLLRGVASNEVRAHMQYGGAKIAVRGRVISNKANGIRATLILADEGDAQGTIVCESARMDQTDTLSQVDRGQSAMVEGTVARVWTDNGAFVRIFPCMVVAKFVKTDGAGESDEPLLPPTPPGSAPDEASTSMAFESAAVLPTVAKSGADESLLGALDDVALSAMQIEAGDEVRFIGKSDIDAMLGFEKAKDLIGCNDIACTVEIAGALGVQAIVTASLAKLGSKHLLTLAIISQKDASVLSRHTEDLGNDPETFDKGVEKGVQALLHGLNGVTD